VGDYFHLWLKFDQEQTPVQPDDPYAFAYEITGRVVMGDENDRDILVGRFRVFYIDADTVLNGRYCSYFDVMDTRSETAPYYEYLFGGPQNSISPELEELLGEAPACQNALILDRLEILPKFRGKRFGLLVLRRLIERFSAGVGIVAMKPFALQLEATWPEEADEWRERMKLKEFPKDENRSIAKLRWYYAQLGFKRLPNSEFMFLGADAPLKSVADLLAGEKSTKRSKAR
jgi:GNAT superfamily N-acetyltransferase